MLFRAGITAAVLTAAAVAQQAGLDHFEKKIRPVLASRCYGCHSGAAVAPQGGLRLDSASGIRKGGNSGSDLALLLRAIRHTDKKLKMPPDGPLSQEIVADF